MLVWLLKFVLLLFNIRAAHKALAPSTTARERTRSRSGGKSSNSNYGERARRRQIREEVVNWVVLTLFVTAEKFADRTIGRVLPFFGTAKCIVLVLLLVLRGPGSQQIYDKLVVPLIRPYERPLDLIGFVTNEVLDLFLAALLSLPKYAARKLKARRGSQDVPAILRGLRQPHHSKLAASLADSIERSQDDTSAISARFSQPVRVRSQPLQVRSQPVPFKPRRAGHPELASQSDYSVTMPRPSTVSPPSQEPHLPPPPVASTAPFRPVPIIKGSQIPRPSAQEAQDAFEVPRRAKEDALVGQQAVSSIYPSLAEVSTPLSVPRVAVSPTSEASNTTPARRLSPAETQHGSVNGDARVETVPSGSLRNKRQRTPPRRAEPVAAHSSESVTTSSRPSSPTSAVSGPPPTPAPPGAFNFKSPDPTPETATNVTAAAESPTTRQAPLEMSIDDDRSTPSRRSSRHSTATPRASRTRTSSRLSAVAPPDEATDSQSSRRKRSAVASVSTTPERPSKRTAPQDSKTAAAAGTPRQRALGAIAQLSKDLLSEDAEPEPSTLGLAGRKKAGSGVLGRSVRGTGSAPPPLRRTARGRGRTAGDSVEGGASDTEGTGSAKVVVGPAKVSPQKRKLRDEVDSEGDGRNGTEVRPPAKKSATAKKGGSGTSAVPSLGSRSRLPAKTATSAVAAEPTKPAASTSTATSKMRRITAENAIGVPAPRRARRILLGRAGPGAAEEEEEIDGVPVVARRRRQQL